MNQPWASDWRRLRGVLLRVRRAVAARGVGDVDREATALRNVAAEPVFATLHTDADLAPQDRGRLIATYIAALVRRILDEYPDHDQWGTSVLRAWLRIVTEGLTARDLAAETSPPGASADQTRRAEQRTASRLWLGGNQPSRPSAPAIHALYETVSGGLQADLAPGGRTALLADSVAWQWNGLRQRGDVAACSLLAILAFVAPEYPVWISTLTEGWGPLPEPLRTLVQQPPLLRPTLTHVA